MRTTRVEQDILNFAVAPDRKTFATVEDGRRVRLWDAAAAKPLAVLCEFPNLPEKEYAVEAPRPERMARLLAGLDDDSFARREEASRELAGLAEVAEADLRRLLASKPSAEARRRAEALLKGSVQSDSPRRLWGLRVTAVLEQVGNEEAQELLGALARGAPGAWVTREAKASLERLGQRPTLKQR